MTQLPPATSKKKTIEEWDCTLQKLKQRDKRLEEALMERYNRFIVKHNYLSLSLADYKNLEAFDKLFGTKATSL